MRLMLSNTACRQSLRITLIVLVASLIALLPGALSGVQAQISPSAKLVLLGPQQQLIAALYQGTGAKRPPRWL